MAQIAVKDELLEKARSLLRIKSITDEEIMEAALDGWIFGKMHQPDLDAYRGKLDWDPEFAGVGSDYRRPVW